MEELWDTVCRLIIGTAVLGLIIVCANFARESIWTSKKMYGCRTPGPDKLTVNDGTSRPPECQGVQVMKGKLWKGKTELRVYFINKCNWNKKTVKHVLEVANQWHNECPSVPKFVKQKLGKQNESDIRVEFTGNGMSETVPGTGAEKYKGLPTMWLDLANPNDEHNYHVVLHEFGHALGFAHEHQCSLFLKHFKKFLIVSEMKKLPNYKRDYESPLPAGTQGYDPHSIMHYWFDSKWLKDEYRYMKSDQIPSACRALSASKKEQSELRKVLEGILLRRNCLPIQLSRHDITFAEKEYSGDDEILRFNSAMRNFEVTYFADPIEVKKALEGINDWQTLGQYLGMKYEKLERIRLDKIYVKPSRDEMIQQWMKGSYGASWQRLYKALRGMDEAVLAKAIRKTYID